MFARILFILNNVLRDSFAISGAVHVIESIHNHTLKHPSSTNGENKITRENETSQVSSSALLSRQRFLSNGTK